MRRQATVTVVCGIMVAATLASVAGAADPDTPVVLTIADHDWPPFLFAGRAESPPGIVKELMQRCLPATGYSGRFEFYPINRMFAYLEDGKIDVNVMSRTAEREAYVSYGREPMFSSSYRPFVSTDRDLVIRSLQDLDTLRVGHLAGLECSAAYRSYIDTRIAAGSVVVTTTQESLIRMLLAGRIDVFVLPRESLSWHAHSMGVRGQIKALDLDIRTSDYFVTVSKNSKLVADIGAFLEAMDACLSEAKSDGSYARILHGYGIE